MHYGCYSVTCLLVDGRVAASTRPALNMRYQVKTVFRPIVSSPYTFLYFAYISVGVLLRKK